MEKKYGAAPCRNLCLSNSTTGPTPVAKGTARAVCVCRMPMGAARQVSNLLGLNRRTGSIHELEEWDEVHAQRQGLTPSEGREGGKRPRIGLWSPTAFVSKPPPPPPVRVKNREQSETLAEPGTCFGRLHCLGKKILRVRKFYL